MFDFLKKENEDLKGLLKDHLDKLHHSDGFKNGSISTHNKVSHSHHNIFCTLNNVSNSSNSNSTSSNYTKRINSVNTDDDDIFKIKRNTPSIITCNKNTLNITNSTMITTTNTSIKRTNNYYNK